MNAQEQRDGLSSRYVYEKHTPKSSRDWKIGLDQDLKKLSTTILDSMEGEKNTGKTDELRYLISFPLCPVVCSGSSGSLALGFLRCDAQNPRIQLTLKTTQRIQYSYACVFFFQKLARLIEIRRTAHCHLTVCKCKPCQWRKSHLLLQTFFRGVMTPTLTPVRPGP